MKPIENRKHERVFFFLVTDHFRLFGLKQRGISLRHSLRQIKKINAGKPKKLKIEGGSEERRVFKQRRPSSDTWSGETWQMLAIPARSRAFLALEPCPNCHNGGGER